MEIIGSGPTSPRFWEMGHLYQPTGPHETSYIIEVPDTPRRKEMNDGWVV